MSKCCNENDIELVVLPRFKVDGEEISGSESRKAIFQKDIARMEKLLPEPTVQYIINEMNV